MDLVGPLPPSQGFKYLFTIVDRFTRWPEAIPLKTTDAKTCARALLYNWVARFGLPLHVTSDRGPQFTSKLWSTVSRLLGIKLHHTTAYHPQANGLVERFHRHLKSSLRARLTGSNWMDALPWVLLGIRSAPKQDLGCSSAELLFGTPVTVTGNFVAATPSNLLPQDILPQLRDAVSKFLPVPTSRHCKSKSFVFPDLPDSDFVFIRRDENRPVLQKPYEGPFRVIERAVKIFTIDYGGKPNTISIDRLKAAHLDKAIRLAQPRRRGRPSTKQQADNASSGGESCGNT